MAQKPKTLQGLKPFPPAKYQGMNLNRLVMIAVGKVEDAGLGLSFEHIVVAAFKLFPKKFSLLGYSRYPDAKRVHDSLWRCSYKDCQWLIGKTSQGFSLTQKGRAELDLALQELGAGSATPKQTFSQTRRFEVLVAEVKASPAFQKFQNAQRDKVSESECCHVLQGTLDSDRRVLRDNLFRLKQIAVELKQSEMTEFMEWLESRFARALEG